MLQPYASSLRHISLAIILFSVLPGNDVFAQRFGVKVSQNTDLMRVSTSSFDDAAQRTTYSDRWNTNFTRFTISILFEGKRNFDHELELFLPENKKALSHLQFPYAYQFQQSSSNANYGSSYAFRYILSKRLTSGDKPLSFKIGAAVNPYYVNYKQLGEGEFYPGSKTILGTSVNFVPALNYNFGNHFRVSLDAPVKIYDYKYVKTWTGNPAVPIRERNRYSTKNDFFDPAFTLRVGVAYMF